MDSKVTIDETVCKGCGLCVTACPKHIVMIDRSKLNSKGYHPAVASDCSECIACAFCAIMCPDSAIIVRKVG